MKQVYGVFLGSKWGITSSKKKALQAIKVGAGFIRVMSYAAYKDSGGWDAPTFIACSEPLQ
jgi:hypothetical protein